MQGRSRSTSSFQSSAGAVSSSPRAAESSLKGAAASNLTRSWAAIFDRYPACIARCNSPQDVVAALRFARERGLTIAVRGGGHSAAGFSTCNGGMLLDLRPIQGVAVDARLRVALVGGGAHLSQLDEATQRAGLACPVGVIGTPGSGA